MTFTCGIIIMEGFEAGQSGGSESLSIPGDALSGQSSAFVTPQSECVNPNNIQAATDAALFVQAKACPPHHTRRAQPASTLLISSTMSISKISILMR